MISTLVRWSPGSPTSQRPLSEHCFAHPSITFFREPAFNNVLTIGPRLSFYRHANTACGQLLGFFQAQRNKGLETSSPSKIFKSLIVSKSLHFPKVQEYILRGHPSYKPLQKTQRLINLLAPRISQAYYPYRSIGVECRHFQDRCYFRKYMPNRRTKRGFKVFPVCDATTHYARCVHGQWKLFIGTPRRKTK